MRNPIQSLQLLFVTSSLLSSNPNLVEANGAASAAASAAKTLDYRYFVAGGVCAATSHGITCPIDVVKTRMQANPEVYNKGMVPATLNIIKENGPQVLLTGLGPTIAGYGIEGAMKFGIYEIMKPITKSIIDNQAIAYIMASVIAGAVASILLCPMESLRIRQVTDPEYAERGLWTGLPMLIKEEGLASTFSGIWAMLAKQVPYTMAKQVSFDVFAKILYSYFESLKTNAAETFAKEDVKWVVSVSAAFIASIFACIFSQPGDMILTETYKGKNDRNVFGVMGDIYREKGGLLGFFTGTGARIVHVGAIITTQLVIYDVVKQGLGLPATGSH
uniref:Mitochondrial carrier protein n=1 Tax=Helicotheca tamesis TaxID=374047 RepID=A0A7S2ME68_9STRA|mmetsp:Transcript_1440/g.2059  ORF Transcript_1440/g.2059 Transcript_1440/m.2059 type:complete len:332 (+) Transcript_1440:202-1197(+)|eukprot:CAMPEP_0185728408 /NCGR_PEP_ID=MMETSP1171-20130828/3755_1 /TAXON_ID=374046 /ORGANISM="Helicotheca tamensis, Strain CCMP826" /LENGTH=331 /DNA_ID=CAMNT_0028397117 /DNA_START=176 /DNA_END=1171 /DNA_ORIENTATION=+